MTSEQALMVMNRAIETLHHFPSIVELNEIWDGIKANAGPSSKPKVSCSECDGSGWFICTHEENGGRGVAGCEKCKAGSYQLARMAKWSDGSQSPVMQPVSVMRRLGYVHFKPGAR